jgi:hypothetical protein
MAPKTPNIAGNFDTIAGRRPEPGVLGWIKNLALSESSSPPNVMGFFFRPYQPKHSISVNYNDMVALGMSHAYQVYQSTGNGSWTFEVYENALMIVKERAGDAASQGATTRNRAGTVEGDAAMVKAISQEIEGRRRFLEALTVPAEVAPGVIGSEPPAVILCIPGILSQRCRLMSLNETYTDCFIDGSIKELVTAVEFKEAPMGRMTMQDVLANGSVRNWGQG